MRSAIRALNGHVRTFFDGPLRGLFAFDQVRFHPLQETAPRPDGRRSLDGRYVERVAADFGPFRLLVAAPEEDPPLGWITVEHLPTGARCEGPLDREIWNLCAQFIKERLP